MYSASFVWLWCWLVIVTNICRIQTKVLQKIQIFILSPGPFTQISDSTATLWKLISTEKNGQGTRLRPRLHLPLYQQRRTEKWFSVPVRCCDYLWWNIRCYLLFSSQLANWFGCTFFVVLFFTEQSWSSHEETLLEINVILFMSIRHFSLLVKTLVHSSMSASGDATYQVLI